MELYIIILAIIICLSVVYFAFSKSEQQWRNFIIQRGYKKYADMDELLKIEIKKILNILNYRKIYKKNERDGCSSWIIQAETNGDADDPLFTYIILSFKDKTFPSFWLSNIKRPVNKLPGFWKVIYKKSLKHSLPQFTGNNLKLIEEASNQISLPTFTIFAESKEKVDEFFSDDIIAIFKEWPTEILNQIFIIDNFIIISPKWFKRTKEWQSHLNSKDKLIKIIKRSF